MSNQASFIVNFCEFGNNTLYFPSMDSANFRELKQWKFFKIALSFGKQDCSPSSG